MLAKYLHTSVVDLINLSLIELYYIHKSAEKLIEAEQKEYNKIRK